MYILSHLGLDVKRFMWSFIYEVAQQSHIFVKLSAVAGQCIASHFSLLGRFEYYPVLLLDLLGSRTVSVVVFVAIFGGNHGICPYRPACI